MRGFKKNPSEVGMFLKTVFSHQRISQKVVRTSFEKQLDPSFSRDVRIRTSKETYATCDFQWWVQAPALHLDPPMLFESTGQS